MCLEPRYKIIYLFPDKKNLCMRAFDVYLSALVISTDVEKQSKDETLPQAMRDLLPLIKELQDAGMKDALIKDVFKPQKINLPKLNWDN